MTAPKITDFAPWPDGHAGATADVMAAYYLACAAWHSGRLNAVADMPRAEFMTSAVTLTLSYAAAQLLRKLHEVAPGAADELAQHIYEVVDSGEGGEWVWEALQETGRTDAGDIFTAGERSVPAGPSLIRTEVEGLRAAAAELRGLAAKRTAEAAIVDPNWKPGTFVDADWLDTRADRISRGGAGSE